METSKLRKRMPVATLLDPKVVGPAIGQAFVKLNPVTLIKNPVIFVLEIVTALTTIFGNRRPGAVLRVVDVEADLVLGRCLPRQAGRQQLF